MRACYCSAPHLIELDIHSALLARLVLDVQAITVHRPWHRAQGDKVVLRGLSSPAAARTRWTAVWVASWHSWCAAIAPAFGVLTRRQVATVGVRLGESCRTSVGGAIFDALVVVVHEVVLDKHRFAPVGDIASAVPATEFWQSRRRRREDGERSTQLTSSSKLAQKRSTKWASARESEQSNGHTCHMLDNRRRQRILLVQQ
eukprot:COSAG05_NODE_2077_length_3603_cov_18.751712_6_plen_201_part_00